MNNHGLCRASAAICTARKGQLERGGNHVRGGGPSKTDIISEFDLNGEMGEKGNKVTAKGKKIHKQRKLFWRERQERGGRNHGGGNGDRDAVVVKNSFANQTSASFGTEKEKPNTWGQRDPTNPMTRLLGRSRGGMWGEWVYSCFSPGIKPPKKLEWGIETGGDRRVGVEG